MPLEIERKFLVSQLPDGLRSYRRIRQSYLQSDPTKSVRVRIIDAHNKQPSKAFLTIKGAADIGHFARPEFEYEIQRADAETMMAWCDHPPIEKKRYLYHHENTLWEIDEFLGSNAGLLLAEVELEKETDRFFLPKFLSREVTADPKYFNLYLAYHPYTSWTNKEKETV